MSRAEAVRQWKRDNPAKMALYRKRERLKKIGWTAEEYDAVLEAQDGRCAICRRPETVVLNGKLKGLSADHDHETGQPRELLCHHCNAGLGHFQDSVDCLERAADYLRKHKEVTP